LRRQLRIARPGDDVDVHLQVGILGLEAVDEGRHDPAFALGRADVGAAAVDRAAFPEEALDGDLGAFRACVAAADEGGERESSDEASNSLHRTAAPAMAATICFWKMM